MKINLTGSALRPGDKLVLTTEKPLTAAEAAQVQHLVKEKLPGVEVVILPGIQSQSVYRPQHGAKETR